MPAAADEVATAGFHQQAATVSRPATVPSLDGWKDTSGVWTLGQGSRVVASQESELSRAQMLSEELTAFAGFSVPSATGVSNDKDVVLTLDGSRSSTLGDEGFTLSIGASGLQVIGATDIGVFYGTRAVSQLLRQGQLTLPAGEVTTVPKYKERGATLCACQINISTDWIDRFLEDMADNRLNYVLMEMKLKPESENTKKAETWSYYTRDDVKRFVQKAKHYGIEVIPEINSPGHMNVWLENYPEYQLEDKNGKKHSDQLDISNPEAVKFYETLIDEYDGVFDTDYWHMGADEYMIGSSFSNYPKLQEWAKQTYGENATPNDAFTAFINNINDYVKAKGKKLRIWNDGIVNTQVVKLNEDIVVEYWDAGNSRTPQDLVNSGIHVMNASGALYWSRSNTSFTVDVPGLYNNKHWNAGTFVGNHQIDPDSPHLLGAKVSIWPDNSDVQTENEVEQQIFYGIRFIAQMTWSASRPWENWNGMKAAVDSIGKPLANRRYVYQPVAEGTYEIPQLDAVAKGPWQLVATPDGYYQMRNVGQGTCLTLDQGVEGEGLVPKHLSVVTQVGARPRLTTCEDVSVTWESGRDAAAARRNVQKWEIRQGTHDGYTITSALTQQRLAVSTGKEQHIDVTTMRGLGLAPKTGEIAQFPPDLVGENAEFTLNETMGVRTSVSASTVSPSKPVDITVYVDAPHSQNSGVVTITPQVPEGWKVLPGKVSLQSIPAGKTARAIFRVVNTTAMGAASIAFTITTERGMTMSAAVPLQASMMIAATTSDPVANSEEHQQEDGSVTRAFDDDPNTFWHTAYSTVANPPHWVSFKASTGGKRLTEVSILPRQDKKQGIIKDYKLYVVAAGQAGTQTRAAGESKAPTDWGVPVAQGTLPWTQDWQTITVPQTVPTGDVWVKVEADSMYLLDGGDGEGVSYASVASLRALVPDAPIELTEPQQPTDNPVATEEGNNPGGSTNPITPPAGTPSADPSPSAEGRQPLPPTGASVWAAMMTIVACAACGGVIASMRRRGVRR